eukprot:scaffold7422_cov99-Amphora_coffeaeformis.AAC.1
MSSPHCDARNPREYLLYLLGYQYQPGRARSQSSNSYTLLLFTVAFITTATVTLDISCDVVIGLVVGDDNVGEGGEIGWSASKARLLGPTMERTLVGAPVGMSVGLAEGGAVVTSCS